MPEMDIFDNDAFSFVELTDRINRQPPVPGQIGDTLDFEERGVPTTSIAMIEINGTLQLVEPSARGGPGETIDHDKRTYRRLDTAHFQRDEHMYADEVQGVRNDGFGGQNGLLTVQQMTDIKLARHARDFDLTNEYLKMGVLNGKVVSGKGVVVIDIYKEFGLVQPDPVDFVLNDQAAKVRLAADELRYGMEQDLDATAYGEVIAFCGNELWRKLIEHKEVRETYLNTAAAVELRNSLPDDFSYGGIHWIRLKAGRRARAAVGGSFIPEDEARVCFKGVPDLYKSYFAPADYWDTVNTIGLPRYAREMTEDRTAKSARFEVQTNPLHVITQPKTLRRLKLA
ncbi:hypothetical protein BA190_10140 [Labrys sp. WJW]|uniref:major capsid protein n=1 Tax=Labrys sp. WJW TaxID=1737983 RepID=UPI0008356EFF|nr:major capsid protein [Labrys sp. WJW]OCC05253.1 hypothetical protein BA190_10140 [Labrys sp. WJW]